MIIQGCLHSFPWVTAHDLNAFPPLFSLLSRPIKVSPSSPGELSPLSLLTFFFFISPYSTDVLFLWVDRGHIYCFSSYPIFCVARCSAPRNNYAEIQHNNLTKKCHPWLTDQSHWFSSGGLEEVGIREARRREQKWGLKYLASCFLYYQLRRGSQSQPWSFQESLVLYEDSSTGDQEVRAHSGTLLF